MRLVIGGITSDNCYSLQFEKDDSCERCYVVFWEANQLKKVCVGSESLERSMPISELEPTAQVVSNVDDQRLPVAVRDTSSSLLRDLDHERTDGRLFVVQRGCKEDICLKLFRQAHQYVFGMIEIVTLVEFVVVRMQSVVYDRRQNVVATVYSSRVCPFS